MDPLKVQLVQQSFGRCLLNKTLSNSFLDAFYEEFLASDPRIKPMFSNTDMEKQKDLLKQGLVMLLMYGKGSAMAKSAIEQLALKHDHNHLNIEPWMYRLWVQSLLACVNKYDPNYDDALNAMWNEALDLGIGVMKQAY